MAANSPSLASDLQSLMAKPYREDERIVLKYAISLAEILEKRPAMEWTFDEFRQLPDGLELDKGLIQPKRWQMKSSNS